MISSPFFLWLCAEAVDGASRAAASSSIESDVCLAGRNGDGRRRCLVRRPQRCSAPPVEDTPEGWCAWAGAPSSRASAAAPGKDLRYMGTLHTHMLRAGQPERSEDCNAGSSGG